MKLIDRYVLLSFLKNYVIAFGVLVSMYISLDMVVNFSDLFELGERSGGGGLETFLRALRNVADFYAYQSLVIFVQLSPVIPVVAAAFTLLRMTRFNELVAVLAAGVPLVRVAMPIVIATVALSFLALPLQEYVIPANIPKLLRDHDDVGRDARRSFQVKALEDARGALLVAARFNPATATAPASMIEVDLLVRDEASRQPLAHVRAERAQWDAAQRTWVLTNARVATGLSPDEVRSFERPIATLPTTLTPEEITLYRSRDFVDFLPISRINELLAAPRSYGVVDLLRVKHFRITQYLNNIILILLVLPCVMTREPRSLKTGGVFLLSVMGVYLGTIFLCQHLAGTPAPSAVLAPHWPALMAWMPALIFGPAVFYAIDRIKT
jgi:lipopolysaccharide export system permease protein